MKAGVVVFPGSNCDHDCYNVSKHIMGWDTSFIWHKEVKLPDLDLIILPGGFSYGDYLRCGALAARSPIMSEIKKFVDRGGYVIGICNGFQILTESLLLPGALKMNDSLNFICKKIYLNTINKNIVFTKDIKDKVLFPIAHHDGSYYIDDDGLKSLYDNNQIVFKYEKNPNGSVADIAGVCSKNGRVLGLMPHPERSSDNINDCDVDGLSLFKSIERNLK